MSYPILFSPENSYNIDLIPAIAGVAVSGKSIAGKTDTESVVESWDTQGLGVLTDAVKCRVYEEINGQYELTLEYPKTGRHYDEIGKDSIILVEVPNEQNKQAFRVYEIEKTLRGTTEFQARHISYDLVGYPVKASPVAKTGIVNALNSLTSDAVITPPFTFTTDKTNTTTQFRVTATGSIRSWLGGREGSILDKFGGEWHWDNYTCELLNRRGSNNGYTIKYAKNLTSLRNVLNNEKTYTGVVCVYTDADGNTIASDVKSTGVGQLVNILSVDVTAEYSRTPTVAQLNTKAQNYIASAGLNNLNETSITLSFVDNPEIVSSVGLGDTVTIQCEDLDFSSRIVKSTFDVLLDRYIELTVGKVVATLSDTIHSIENTTDITDTRNVLKITTSDLAIPEPPYVVKAGQFVVRPLNADADMTYDEWLAYAQPKMFALRPKDYFTVETDHIANLYAKEITQAGGGTRATLWANGSDESADITNDTVAVDVYSGYPSTGGELNLTYGLLLRAKINDEANTNNPPLYICFNQINIRGSLYGDSVAHKTEMSIDGKASLTGDLSVGGKATAIGGVVASADSSVTGNFNVDGDLTVNGTIANGQAFTQGGSVAANSAKIPKFPLSWNGIIYAYRDSSSMAASMVRVNAGGTVYVTPIVSNTEITISASGISQYVRISNTGSTDIEWYYIGSSTIS